MMRAPFPPLVPHADGLDRPPAAAAALRARMAAVYGLAVDGVLPVRGALHGIALVLRAAAANGDAAFAAAPSPEMDRLAGISRLARRDAPGPGVGALILVSPSPTEGYPLSLAGARAQAAAIAPAWLVVDETFIEFAEAASLVTAAEATPNLVVLRSLACAYGLAGAPCGALVANPKAVALFADMLEPEAIATPVQQLALAALDPSRAALTERRIALVKAERARLAAALAGAPAIASARAGEGPFVFISTREAGETEQALRRLEVDAEPLGGGVWRIMVGAPDANDRALSAFGAAPASTPRRRAELVRETSETRVSALVDLDAFAPPAVDTGVGFFDHMLAQVAQHGGFTLVLSCKGDLHVDAHHTIEDCALALGQALRQALGDKRGIARFGFLLPMDEAEARLSLDLSGRPALVFNAAFAAPALGAYPTEMTAHVFNSLAQSLGAAIHVSVTGANDHHKTEACFKALGRALRQAIAMEGAGTPSTKGTLA